MRKLIGALLVVTFIFLMTACPQEAIPDPPEENNRRPEYALSFSADSKNFVFDDNRHFLETSINADSSQIMQGWWNNNFAGYKGPLFYILASGGPKRITVDMLSNQVAGSVCHFGIDYDNSKGSWLFWLQVRDTAQYELQFVQEVKPNEMEITVQGGDISIKLLKSLKGDRRVAGKKTTVNLSNFFVKGKLLDKTQGDWSLNKKWAHQAHPSVIVKEGVSIEQDFQFSFYKSRTVINGNLQAFLDDTAIPQPQKMDTSVNYIYQNGQKVFGSWNAEGTVFTYKPAVSYQANSRVHMVIPDEMRDVEGNKLYRPYYFSFTTGSSKIGVPNLNTVTKGEGFNSVTLFWSQADPYSVDNHIVERADSATGPFSTIATLIPDDYDLTNGNFAYTDRTVLAGKSYYYRVTTKGKGEAATSKVEEGHALVITPAQLDQQVISTYFAMQSRETCYSYQLVKGKKYSFQLTDKTNNASFTGDGRVRIRYNSGIPNYYDELSPTTGGGWGKSDSFTAPADELFIVIENDTFMDMEGETSNLAFTLTELPATP